ncbi:FAD-dependent oxidoreductase [Pseudonocardia sp. KRD-184]|uniref:ferredoxin--NADP(+) reductase n=1 Tax=Pseudonocardia oceani TaxID=2792013 RepID=A0ABS6UFH1_9PSEU|nr:FAD-dependent oxidoreductase [Pseudonocardia oceani]MBW0092725.1 FAD-dependent oxidoreductase [Pseudonocardia oceani]MBW0099528.1 FAD-dependent oxidoreductase [Pseudonocardia oceani]MBW0112145.1 FAD-dependent oxidoreductase [Pseudonocardia oceani]MBW0124542.1 FAD-dependent oxidoreductase [Pseudonocardia oceani]MBW0130968.1 FAD-dependent oxidoreductase [Pseudonocardia oceani]
MNFRVAVIGAGPSGLYAAAALLSSGEPVSVEVLDRLPAPYGLVRYGVAPDHVKMKSVIRVLQKPFDPADVEFLGGVRIGGDGIPLDELRTHFHAVVHATGSSVDRALGVPGEELAGSLGSGAFVSWYCGHPDFTELSPPLDHPGVAVVGAGNVALDVARVLAKTADEMAATDVPGPVLDALRSSAVRDVHVLIRRGPQHVRFTPAELRQIGDLAYAQVVVHDDGLLAAGVEEPATIGQGDRRQRQNLAMLGEWADRPDDGSPRRIHLRFLRSPVRLLGEGRVSGIVVERTAVDASGRLVGTGEEEVLDVGLVVRAIGYAGEPIPGLPFDEATGTVPNEGGRVVRDGVPVPGAYVTGWIKRGPTGVIGTNKGDAQETVAAVLEDLPSLPAPAHPEPDALREALAAHGIRPVDWTAWLRLDAEEVRRGGLRGAERVKVAELAEMLDAAHGADAR